MLKKEEQMKKLIYLLVILLLIACENSNVVDPEVIDVSDFNNELSKIDGVKIDNQHSRKVYKQLTYQCNLQFNPDQSCGGFLSIDPAQYQYENERERTLRNLLVFIPSIVKINNKVHNTYHLYNINKYENLDINGKVINGKTWGEFQIVLAVNTVPIKNKKLNKVEIIGDELANENPIYEKFGDVLFSGKFSGEIFNRKTKMNLVGQGLNQFDNSSLYVKESIVCSGDFCWKSLGSGTVKKVEYWDE